MTNVPPKLEEYLRKGVWVLGTAVEKLIEQADKLKTTLTTSSVSAQPVLSLEGQLSIPKLKELINSAVEKVVAPAIPPLVDKTALEIREGGAAFAKVFKERGASVAIHNDMGSGGASYGRAEGTSSVKGGASKLPFEDGFFDYIVGNFASSYQGDLIKTVKELSRLLTISGEGVIVHFHPFGMYAKRGGLRLKPAESTIRGIEDYYKICKATGLKVVGVKESFIDETMRSMFVTDEEKLSFRMVKDAPLLIYIFAKKGG